MNIPEYMKSIKWGVICCGLLFALLPHCHAALRVVDDTSGRPVMLYFRFDKSLVDSGYMDNGRILRHLDELLTNRNMCTRIDSINIYSFASPDGNRAYNEQLAQQRSTAVKTYLLCKYPHLDQHRIHTHPQGENWQEFRQLIENDENLPDKKEVLQIIDCNKDSEQRKALLKKLNKGIPYRYIHDRLLPYLRNAAICMVWIRPDSLPTLSKAARLNLDRLKIELHRIPQNKTKDSVKEKNITSTQLPQTTERPLFALKTNLLFDVTLMPNVEIEVPIGKRWSVNGEYMFPWWLLKNDRYCLEILSGGLEGRYWLGSSQSRKRREVLTGHFVGLYAGGGKYDLQWKEDGYQGEFFIAAGISYGLATLIARNLHLEFSIGIGLLRTDYRHYHAQDNYQTLLWQENGNYTWFGPTKAKISLVWLLKHKVKKGGTK